jgi:DNA polymerase-3 subunit epsilon
VEHIKVLTTPVVDSPISKAYMRTPPPGPATPWREAEFCVIDLETTGLDAAVDEIISFAALQIAGGRLRLDDVRYQLIRPRHMPDAETIRIHGLRSGDLANAPTLSAALDGLLAALTGKVLVAHVASVEQAFVGAALREHGLRLSNPIIDTAALAAELQRRRRRPRSDPIDLTSLARSLGLPVHRPHHADGDALTTAQVFLALATHLDAFVPQTVGSLESYRRSPRGWSAFRPALGRVLTRLTTR